MAPKKKDAKKAAPEDDLGLKQANEFAKKGYPAACEAHGAARGRRGIP